MTSRDKPGRPKPGKRLEALALRAYIRALLSLPFSWRRRLAAWLGASAPMRRSRSGKRILERIVAVLPEQAAQAEQLTAEVLANIARTQVEALSGAPFAALAGRAAIEGPGWPALRAAHEAGRPAILLVSHFGNSAAVGAALIARGIVVGSLYKPLPVAQVEAVYNRAMQHYTRPMFPTDRAGVGAMLRHLRGGGMVSISFDLDRPEGVMLDFLGQPSRTPLSMAEMALRHDALLIPVYGLRQQDGDGFSVVIDAAIPHGAPAEMMQAANDSLAAMVRAHPGQWLWWHKRWKTAPPDSAKGA